MWETILKHPGWTAAGVVVAIIALVLANTHPIYALVQDGDLCGWREVRSTITPEFDYTECRHSEHGIEGYEYTETVSLSSGWVGGGRDQAWWCEEARLRKQQAVGAPITWGAPQSSESSRTVGLGRAEYNYRCIITASWGPVYKLGRTNACPRSEPTQVSEQVAQECLDTRRRTGWRFFGITLPF